MSIEITPVSARLQLRLITGTDEDLRPIYRTRSFGNVKPEADNEDLFVLAQGLSGLQIHTMDAIRRVDEVELEEGE